MKLPAGWQFTEWDHVANDGEDAEPITHHCWSVWREADGLVVLAGQGKPPAQRAVDKAIKEAR